jgi:hypothetical protein
MRHSRRSLLRVAGAVAGAGLLSPLARQLVSADVTRPCRLVFFVEGNGFEPVTVLSDAARAALDATLPAPLGAERWWYQRYRHAAPLDVETSDLHTGRSLAALRVGAAGVDLVSKTTVVLGLSSRIIGGGHSGYHGALSSTRTVGGSPGGPTLDAYLAPCVSPSQPFDVVRLGVGGTAALDFGTCATDRGVGAPMIRSPRLAYETLFGATLSGPARDAFDERGILLDHARQDVTAVSAEFVGSSLERAKLEAYLSAIEALEQRHARLLGMRDALAPLAPEPPSSNDLYTTSAGDDTTREAHEAQFELVAAALLGDLTRLAVIGSGSGGEFSLLLSSISGVGRHDMQHGSGRDPALLEAVHDVTAFKFDLVARLARVLENTPEGDGTMLDRTLIVCVPDNGEQHHSTASEFPVVLIGGQGLGLRPGGRTVIYPGIGQAGHRQLSNLWNTLGHLVGEDLNEFGDEGPTRVAPGPLSELLV